jgi:hypothetical protein
MTKPQLALAKGKELETDEGAKAFLEALGISESEGAPDVRDRREERAPKDNRSGSRPARSPAKPHPIRRSPTPP